MASRAANTGQSIRGFGVTQGETASGKCSHIKEKRLRDDYGNELKGLQSNPAVK